MADLEVTTPNIDAMDDAQFDELKGKMMAGEDVSVPVENTDTAAADPVVTDDAGTADDDGEQQADATRQESVPFGRFHRENERRKEAENDAKSAREQNRILIERLDAMLQMAQPRDEQPTQTVPDLSSEPLGFIDHLGRKVQGIEEQITARAQQEQSAAYEAQIMNGARQEFEAAQTADPAIRDAYTRLFESFAREAQDAYGLTGQALVDYMDRTERQHIFFARQNNIPLDKYVRAQASARGWTPAQVQAAQSAVDPAAQIAKIAGVDAIKQASTSLTATGGAPARTGTPTPQELLEMTPKQFDAWREKNDIRAAFSA